MTTTETTTEITEPRTAVLTDMRALMAANIVAAHKNTKHRDALRSVYVTETMAVGCDSYRLVVVGVGDLKDADVETLHAAAVADKGEGILVPADLVTMAAKITKTGPVTVTVAAGTVTLQTAGGQTFTGDVPGADYPRFGHLIPSLSYGICGPATWNPDYLADMQKIGKHLGTSGRATLLVSDALKPSLWEVAGGGTGYREDVIGDALYLLMPIRRS